MIRKSETFTWSTAPKGQAHIRRINVSRLSDPIPSDVRMKSQKDVCNGRGAPEARASNNHRPKRGLVGGAAVVRGGGGFAIQFYQKERVVFTVRKKMSAGEKAGKARGAR